MNRRAQQQVTGLERENEALSTDAVHSRRLADALKETLGDTNTKAETLQTRVELCTAELAMRDREMRETNDQLLRARGELVERKHQWAVESTKNQADMEGLHRSYQRMENEFTQAKHAAQLMQQEHIADVQLLRLDLQRARDELANAKREAATDADAAEAQLQAAKRIAAERLSSERDRSDLEIKGMQDRTRTLQSQVEQARLDGRASLEELRAALEAATKASVLELKAEHDRRAAEWERRQAGLEAERAQHIATNTTQKEQLREFGVKHSELAVSLEVVRTQSVAQQKAAELEKGRMCGEMDALRGKLEIANKQYEELMKAQKANIEEMSELRTTLDMTIKSHAGDIKDLHAEITSKANRIHRLQQANEAQTEAAVAMRQAEIRRVEGLESALQTCVANASC